LGLRFGELGFAMPPELRAPLVAGDRLVELALAALEPLHDLLELGDRLLEAHGLNVGRNLRIGHRLVLQERAGPRQALSGHQGPHMGGRALAERMEIIAALERRYEASLAL